MLQGEEWMMRRETWTEQILANGGVADENKILARSRWAFSYWASIKFSGMETQYQIHKLSLHFITAAT
jgi:hypothetical protein